MVRFLKDIFPSLILCNLFWCGNRICTIPPEYWQTKVVHPIGLYFFSAAICLCAFHVTSYNKLSWKVLFLFLFIVSTVATVMYCTSQFYLMLNFTYEELATAYRQNPTIAVDRFLPGARIALNSGQQLILVSICYLHVKMKRLEKSKSDKPNNENILIVLVYPKNWVGLILLTFWRLPVTTIKLYYKNNLYGFDKKEGMLIKEKSSFKQIESCFIRDTKLNTGVEKILFSLVNVKWSIRRNCLNVFEPVIGKVINYI